MLYDTMKEFTIYTRFLPQHKRHHKYMNCDGQFDYLGQILTQMGHPPQEKMRFPSEMQQSIPPFCFPIRGSYLDTELTVQIIRLDYADPAFHEARLNELLNPHNMSVKFVNTIPELGKVR
jgi:hypothetical protein